MASWREESQVERPEKPEIQGQGPQARTPRVLTREEYRRSVAYFLRDPSNFVLAKDHSENASTVRLRQRNGGLMIDVYDTGPAVEQFIGRDDYEYGYFVAAPHMKTLATCLSRDKHVKASPGLSEKELARLVEKDFEAFGGRAGGLAYRLVREKYVGDLGAAGLLNAYCKDHGIPVKFSSYP